MFASIHVNFMLTLAMMTGCLVSKPFAASVVAGAVGVFLACAIVLMKRSGQPVFFQVMRRLRG